MDPVSSAASRVFHLPELLESILLQLNTKDLLLGQRTTQDFRNTILGSVRLRRKLFLEPDWDLQGCGFAANNLNNRPGRKPLNNHLLLRAFPGCYPTITLVISSDGRSQQTTFATRGKDEWSWDVCISFPADTKPIVSPAVTYPEASWRKMYLSQPPCKSLYLVRRWQRSLRPAMVREDGITMGDFFEEVTTDAPGIEGKKWHHSYISSDRDWHFEGNVKCGALGDHATGTMRGRNFRSDVVCQVVSKAVDRGRGEV
ncbi:unnamed protein product [Zymoseptoria tritici ST99CH_3D7]|uniref:F-box domain-containing protein n=1 Tax=Zymoseptoria tritici (strain ST99CH_3D7) TaxID=1276538 RepID=A0A1X7RN38_ZYMT9|nr:unnamed protein product [Zymoseptoria tritici ST99CH_3D7]